MSKVLLGADPAALAETYVEADGDSLVVCNTQDAEPIIENNKRLYNLNDGYSPSRLTRRVASLPMVVYFDLKKRGILDDPKAFSRWLNDPDNRFFRTAPGKV
jgi:hypothetical protein